MKISRLYLVSESGWLPRSFEPMDPTKPWLRNDTSFPERSGAVIPETFLRVSFDISKPSKRTFIPETIAQPRYKCTGPEREIA